MTEGKLKPFIRRSLFWCNILVLILLVLGIFVCIEIISHNHNHTIDLTPDKKYTLSEATMNILEGLDDHVNIVSFHKMGQREENAGILERLASASSMIKIQLIDLDRNPGKARMYEVSSSGVTLIEYKGKKTRISFPKENILVNAILKLTSDRKKTLFLSKGHGERDLNSLLIDTLQEENWNTTELYLSGKSEIPFQNETVLIISDPQKDFFPREIDILSQYLDRGGKIVLLLETFVELPSLEAFLRKYRIVLKNDVIIDKENKLLGGDYFSPLIPYLSRVPFLEKMRAPLLLSSARSVDIADALSFNVSAQVLASTSETAWTKQGKEGLKAGDIVFQEGIDRPGPVSVAVWINLTEKDDQGHQSEGEIVCVGDADFIDDPFFEAMGNKDFILNTLEYLGRDTILVSTRQKSFDYPYHFLDASQGSFVFWISIIIMPAIFLVIGVFAIMFRRFRG